MKKLKVIILVFALTTELTFSNGDCIVNDNWYWTTVTSVQGQPVSCPNIPSNLPAASISSKVEFTVSKVMLILLPITAITGIVMVVKTRDTRKNY